MNVFVFLTTAPHFATNTYGDENPHEILWRWPPSDVKQGTRSMLPLGIVRLYEGKISPHNDGEAFRNQR